MNHWQPTALSKNNSQIGPNAFICWVFTENYDLRFRIRVSFHGACLSNYTPSCLVLLTECEVQHIVLQELVEKPLVQAGIAEPGFVNMYALNIYQDGSEGIQMHYDDPQRFERPIISLRLFSDARLAFGTKGYGYVPNT
jgi:hypothetical protein